ncbi:Vitamin B12-binding protein [Mycobacterium sp. smrl_JER01]
MKIITISATGVLALGATSCAADGTEAAAPEAQSAQGAQGEGIVDYPLSLENCGVEVTYPAPPQRAVTLNQTAAEILLRLGVGDRVVGTGYEIEEISEDIAPQYDAIPQLSAHGQEIKHEALLNAQPDFVYSSFASFLTAEQSGSREELHRLGVPTYLTEFDCSYHVAVPNASFELLFDEYRDMARIFDVPTRGEQLVADQQAVIDRGVDTARGIEGSPTVMWFYSTFGGTPYAAGPGGLPQYVSELVGVKNIFDDASTKWPEVSWDEVAARNPDVMVLADLTRGEPGDTAQEKIELLKSDPLTRELPAVRNDQFVVIPGSYMDPGYNSAYAVPALAEGIVGLR